MDKILKRPFDIVVSAVGLLLLAFPFAVIALAIKFSSGHRPARTSNPNSARPHLAS
jgi:lipopolysaccharide/colanic/teichoic acid biosynthesis glycosyltransferase